MSRGAHSPQRRLFLALLAFAAACDPAPLDLSGWSCREGQCAAGFDCHPEQNLCVPALSVGCGAPGAVCPSATSTGDPCPAPGAFLPCVDEQRDCTEGCRTCTEGLTWSACSLGRTRLEVRPVYAAAPRWNDYVRVSDPTLGPFRQPGSLCDGTEAGYWGEACLHAGELRKVVVPGETSCGDLRLTDDAAAFEWVCAEEPSGAVFYSRGLAPGRGLADLLEPSGWRALAVTLWRGEGSVARSSAAAWWDNPVLPLPENAGGVTLLLDDVDDDGPAGPDVALAPGTILTLDERRPTAGYNLNLDRLALVALRGGALFYGGVGAGNCNSSTGELGAASCTVASGGQRFLWIELDIEEPADPPLSRFGLLLAATNASVVHQARLKGHAVANLYLDGRGVLIRGVESTGSAGAGVRLNEGDFALLEDVLAASNAGHGISTYARGGKEQTLRRVVARDNGLAGLELNGGWHVRLEGVHVHGNGSRGLIATDLVEPVIDELVTTRNGTEGLRLDSARGARLTRIRAFNNGGDGLALVRPADLALTDVTSAANGGAGLSLTNGERATLTRLTLVNNADRGLSSSNTSDLLLLGAVAANNGGPGGLYFAGPSRARLVDLAAAHGVGFGVYFDGATEVAFSGLLLLGENGQGDCQVIGTTTNPGIAPDCSLTGASTAAVVRDTDLSSSFAGKVLTDDPVNGSDLLGARPRDEIAPGDWAAFVGRRRGWGRDGADFPGVSHQGPCASGELCRIWDFALAEADTVLRGRAAGGAQNRFTAGAPCPPAVGGDQALTDMHRLELIGDGVGDDDGLCELSEDCGAPNTLLVHAVELIGDAVGDDDGLCESFERCRYASSLGADQGAATSGECRYADGLVQGVVLVGADGS